MWMTAGSWGKNKTDHEKEQHPEHGGGHQGFPEGSKPGEAVEGKTTGLLLGVPTG